MRLLLVAAALTALIAFHYDLIFVAAWEWFFFQTWPWTVIYLWIFDEVWPWLAAACVVPPVAWLAWRRVRASRLLLALAPVVMLLGGCETATTALSVLGVQGLTLGGQYLVKSAEEDIAEAREWRGKHKALVAVIEAACIQGANATMADGGWDAAKADYGECLALSVDNQPQILVERLTDRVERARAEREPADGDEKGGS